MISRLLTIPLNNDNFIKGSNMTKQVFVNIYKKIIKLKLVKIVEFYITGQVNMFLET